MSKKKGSGNTMTLKDFHGGSIPSDLPLPSAPGETIRTSDRSGYDRPSSRGNPLGRSDHRSWLQNSSVTRNYGDKTPFFTDTSPIGCNFDEDERKPLDGTSAPRKTINSESSWVPPRVEVKPEYGGNSLGWKVAPVSQTQVGTENSYSARLTEAIHEGANSQKLRCSRDQGNAGVSPNVWAMRKDVARAVELNHSAWSGANAFSKLAHASAIDKVSSGRWQSKTVRSQTDFDIGRSHEVDSRPCAKVNGNNFYNRMDTVCENEYCDVMLARLVESSLAIGGQIQGGRNELLECERGGVSKYSEAQPRHHHPDRVQPALNNGKLGGPEGQHPVAYEPSERPKLKLLPRTKPVENSEPSVTGFLQVYRGGSDSRHVETVTETHGHANFVMPDSARTESSKEVGKHPKLNLKPRLQALDQSEGDTKKDRIALFGGARPRELAFAQVLKERGVEDVASNNYDAVEDTNRVEHNAGRTDRLPVHSVQTHGENIEDAFLDQRAGRQPERRDHYAERVHGQRRNWHGDNRRNMGVTDRQPSPETWRKPVEQTKSSDAVGLRHSKTTSADELALAFSRSVTDPKMNNRFSGQRGLNTGRAQQPFSRLVGPTAKPLV